MRHVVIVGGGAALAQPLINHYLERDYLVTAVCRQTGPNYGLITQNRSRLRVEIGGGNFPTAVAGVEPIGVLVLMTGSVDNARITDMYIEQWLNVIQSSLVVPFEAMRAGLSRVVDCGNVVVVGSVVGSTGGYGCANYAAAKAGLIGLVRAAANETAARGVCVNLLELGYLDAGMGARLDPKVKEKVLPTIPLGRFGTEEDFVQAVDYLSRVRYMTGNVLTMAGGLR